jgi:hypothetical protein
LRIIVIQHLMEATGAPDDPSDPGSLGDQGGGSDGPDSDTNLASLVPTRRQYQRASINLYQHRGPYLAEVALTTAVADEVTVEALANLRWANPRCRRW